jgi:ABC-type Fe3+ transport system permease subunit
MAINGLWGIVLAAFGVCVFAVTLAFLVAPIFSSEAFLQWVTTTPPCGAGN